MDNYICKIASLEEMQEKWNYETSKAVEDKRNWIQWKKENLDNYQKGYILPYYGILNGTIICEATVHLTAKTVQNSHQLVGDNCVYLSAFRTNNEYQGKGYFSKLFHYMLNDLKNRRYEYATLGVESEEEKNKQIYKHYGFIEYIKSDREVYPDGTTVEVEYYRKTLSS